MRQEMSGRRRMEAGAHRWRLFMLALELNSFSPHFLWGVRRAGSDPYSMPSSSSQTFSDTQTTVCAATRASCLLHETFSRAWSIPSCCFLLFSHQLLSELQDRNRTEHYYCSLLTINYASMPADIIRRIHSKLPSICSVTWVGWRVR